MAKGSSFLFGIGDIFTIPNAKNPTPIKVATPQALDLSFSGDVAQVFGNRRYAVSTAGTTLAVTGTITLGEFQPAFVSRYLLGASKSTGYHRQVEEIVSLTSTGEPATVTYVAEDFNRDLGVVLNLGTRFTRVESSPALYEYSLDETTGTYTFNASQTGSTVAIRYGQFIADEGERYVLTNQLMGSTPSFRLEMVGKFEGKGCTIILNKCTATSYSQSSANDGYTAPTFEFSASVDDSDELGSFELWDYDVE